jgi:KDO2-lipid IV(A) lauroyltransferase
MAKKWYRPLVHGLIDALTQFFFALALLFPYRLFLRMGRVFGQVFYFTSKRHRDVAQASMKQAFGNDVAKNTKLIRDMFSDTIEMLFEMFFYASRKVDPAPNAVIEGEENLKEALARGKGVIAISAHMGCFPTMMAALAMKGYPLHIMMRPLKNEKLGAHADRIMRSYKATPIYSYPRDKAIVDSIRCVKKNGMLVILMDQNYGSGGVWVDFFGELAATPTGATVLALRTGATVLPMYTVRDKLGHHRIIIEKPYEIVRYPTDDESILRNVANLTKIIEGWIRTYPRNWFWFHKRWKSRPSEKVLNRPFMVDKT